MTAAILKQMRPAWIVEDAGVQPDRSNGYAERVMLERGIMLKSRPGRSWKIFAGRSFDAVLVLSQKAAEMLSREAPDWTLFHMTIPDPAAVAEKGVEEETLQAYRNTADQIEAGLTSWIAAFEEAGKDA